MELSTIRKETETELGVFVEETDFVTDRNGQVISWALDSFYND